MASRTGTPPLPVSTATPLPAKPAGTPYEELSFDTSAGRHTCTMFAVLIVQGTSRSNSTRKKSGLFSGTVSLLHSVEVRLPRMARRVEQAGAASFRQSSHAGANAGPGSESVKLPATSHPLGDLPTKDT